MPDTSPVDMLFVTHRHEIAGGAEKALLEMLEYLSDNSYNTHIIVGAEGSFSERLKEISVPYSIIGQPYWAHGPEDDSPFVYSGPNPIVNTTLQTVSLIKKLRPKLCVTNTVVLPWLAYASAITRTPHIWLIHEMGTAGLNLQYAIGEKETLRTIDLLSDAIFYNSQTTAKYYLPQFTHNKDMHLVYPGGKSPSPASIQSPYRQEALKLIIVGQIKPQKGQLEAIMAIKKLRDEGIDTQLAIIGGIEDPDYYSDVKDFIITHLLEDQVILTGHQSNPSSYVAASDISIVASRNEAFGRVTVESMLLGIPVIGAQSGGTIEILEDGQTGLLYEPGSVEDLVSKIKMLSRRPDLMQKISEKALKAATERYADSNRFEDFINYFSNRLVKKALDLSPLETVFSDFQVTADTLRERENRLSVIQYSRAWRFLQLVKRWVKK